MKRFLLVVVFLFFLLPIAGCKGDNVIIHTIQLQIEEGVYHATIEVVLDAHTTSSLPVPGRDGYVFEGWHMDETLLTPFDYELVTQLEFTLYAKWQAIEYTVSYHLNDGENHPANPAQYTVEDDVIELQAAMKAGYQFMGWYDNPGLTGDQVTAVDPTTMGHVTVYASWQATIYDITYELDGGDNHPANPAHYTVEDDTILLQPSVKEGYLFIGWYDNPGFTGDPVPEVNPETMGHVTLFASWETVIYDIDYDLDGGDNHPENPTHYTVEDDTIVLQAPVKEEYLFTGWYDNPGLTGDPVTEVDPETMGHVTLYAAWELEILGDFLVNYHIIQPSETISRVFLGFSHTAALSTDDRIFIWGRNDDGQLGDGTTTSRLTPVEITDRFTLATGETIIGISLGFLHSSALTSAGRLFTWGLNDYGQLGDGTTISRHTPTDITGNFVLQPGEIIIQVATGNRHTAALTSHGRLFIWGVNWYGQLGDGTETERHSPTEITHRFGLGDGETIIQVSLGVNHSSALTSTGRFFTWGWNNSGQLGDGTTTGRNTPTNITSRFVLADQETIIMSALGGRHSSVLTSTGRLFTWGWNDNGQLGDGTTTTRHTPIDVTSSFDFVETEFLMQVSLGVHHTSALTSQGRLFTWGWNDNGQLGDGTIINRHVPTVIIEGMGLLIGETVVQVMATSSHTSALTSRGRLFIWGLNIYGQFGDGTTVDKWTPVHVNIPALGAHQFVIVTSDMFTHRSDIMPFEPELAGYTFSGWFTDETMTELYEFKTMPPENLELYGYWILDS